MPVHEPLRPSTIVTFSWRKKRRKKDTQHIKRSDFLQEYAALADAVRRDTGSLKAYFLKEMLYTEADYAAFVSNLYHCEKVLSESRAKNLLHLDAILPQQRSES